MDAESIKKKVRIAVFPGFFYPHLGGHEKYVEELYAGIVDDSLQIDIIVPNTEHATAEEIYRGLNVYRYDCWNLLQGAFPVPKPNKSFWRLLRRLRNRDHHVVNTHTRFFVNALVGTFFTLFSKAQHMHTEHGTSHPQIRNAFIRNIARIYDHTIGTLVIRHAQIVTAISEASGLFAKHLGAKEYILIQNGVDTSLFSDSKILRDSTSHKIVCSFVGRLIEAKGVQDLILAWSSLSQAQCELHIVGDGPFSESLRLQGKELANVFFHGQMIQSDIINLLQRTDIFVNPSYSEGLPTSVLEAGACGCAVIATNVGGTKEIILDKETGLLINPHDIVGLTVALRFLMDHQQERQAIGNSLMRKVRIHYSWLKITEAFKKMVYELAV